MIYTENEEALYYGIWNRFLYHLERFYYDHTILFAFAVFVSFVSLTATIMFCTYCCVRIPARWRECTAEKVGSKDRSDKKKKDYNTDFTFKKPGTSCSKCCFRCLSGFFKCARCRDASDCFAYDDDDDDASYDEESLSAEELTVMNALSESDNNDAKGKKD